MSDERTSEKFVRATTGGTSDAIASKSQITPFQSVLIDWMDNDWRESHLSPEMFNQTNCAAAVTTQAKQANEHDEK
jgi:hypothetical protein